MQKANMYEPSLGTGAGGFRVAQLVLIGLLPNHCPFILCMAFSASCKTISCLNCY